MEMTQLNTRMSVKLKQAGDEVLARYNKTASEVTRAVWEDMVKHQRPPACAMKTSKMTSEIEDKLASIEQSSHIAQDCLAKLGISWTYDPEGREALWEDMYEEMLAEYEAL